MKKTKVLLLTSFLGILTPLIAIQANWKTGLDEAKTFKLPNASIYSIVTEILSWFLMIFTVLAVISFVIAGIIFLTAGTNSENAEKAKKMITYSIIGIAIALSGYIIIALIDGVLLGEIY